MFQREVAERIVAQPGSKTYGRLSVLAGWRYAGEDPVRHRAVRVRAAAEGDLLAGAARPARSPAALRDARARAHHRGGFRPAPQDAAREPEIARARPAFRCSKTPVSTRPPARRIFRSRVSSHSPEGFKGRITEGPGVMARMIRQSLTAYATPLCETVVEGADAARHRGAGAHQPLRRVPFRRASAGRLFQPWRRQEARRDRAVAAHAALHARPRDRRHRRAAQARTRP